MNWIVIDSDDCKQCPRVLAEIEHIDDEADGAGINFVKIDDKVMAKEFGVFALPAILFFKQHSKEPVIYAGKTCDYLLQLPVSHLTPIFLIWI